MLIRPTTRRSRLRHGFTTVLTAAALAVLTIGTYLFAERHQAPPADTPQQTREKIALAKDFVTREMNAAMTAYQQNTGSYPTTTEGLWALFSAPPRVASWRGPYVTSAKLPIDPWGQPYRYALAGSHNGPGKFDAWSCGPDQLSGTADDIGNW